jgi:hypothetical protein
MNARQARALADRLEPAMRRAFLDSVAALKDAPLRALEAAIDAGSVDGIVRILGLSDASFLPLQEAIRRSYIEAGTLTLAGLNQPPGRRLTIQFGTRNLFAEQYLGTLSSRKVTEIVQDTREAIRVTLEAGQALGQGPRTTALDLVGRVIDGRRQGGVVGLTSQQAGFVANMKAELADPALMANYFTRKRRDARFDRIVQEALQSGKPVAASDIGRITQRYHDRLLQLRGETIARTETMQALNTGTQDALRLVKQEEGLTDNQIRRIWRTAADERVRDSHAAINGESVGLEERFSIGVNYPADPNGAPEEVINCRCYAETRIDWLGGNLP